MLFRSRLAIESGSWHKPEPIAYSDRKCLYCHKLEDELHFVLECKLYSDLRKQYIKKYYWKRPSMIKFIELMKNENVKVVRNLSLFVNKAFKIRNVYMNYTE